MSITVIYHCMSLTVLYMKTTYLLILCCLHSSLHTGTAIHRLSHWCYTWLNQQHIQPTW